jgi:hypothetical protein
MNNRTQKALTSVIAIFGLLAFMCLSWTKVAPTPVSEIKPRSQAHQLICSGASSISSFLTKAKVKLNVLLTAGGPLAATTLARCEQFRNHGDDSLTAAALNPSRPLWLLNRSLLI